MQTLIIFEKELRAIGMLTFSMRKTTTNRSRIYGDNCDMCLSSSKGQEHYCKKN